MTDVETHRFHFEIISSRSKQSASNLFQISLLDFKQEPKAKELLAINYVYQKKVIDQVSHDLNSSADN